MNGLAGVTVADTVLSRVDGEVGHLSFRGIPVSDLAGRSYEDVAGLLLGRPVDLGAGRVAAFEQLLEHPLADPMDALRAMVAGLQTDDVEAVIAAVAVFAAATARRRQGRAPIAPDPSLPHAADYHRMLGLDGPYEPLQAYLVTVMDHGMNASTFAARVVASTGSDLVSSVVAAIGALKGPLHGGAPGPVLDMLDAIGSADRAEAWLRSELAAGRRIMGMGHRVYRVRDPRAAVLERAADSDRADLARAVEAVATRVLAEHRPGRELRANVEFYTAVLLDAVGVPRWLFTPTFAVGRVVGWCAHVAEQRATGTLIRPRARYVGP